VHKVITDAFQEPKELVWLPVFQVGENGFGQGEKSKKKCEYKKVKGITVPSHKKNPVSGKVIDFQWIFFAH